MSETLIGKFTRTFAIKAGTKSKQLVAEDPKRVCVFVQNLGSAAVYIISAQNQAITDGIQVAASGGTYKNDTTTAELYIISGSDEQDVRAQVDGM